jgi:hypothetical protein
MTDLTLALMGISAGIGSAVGAWVALWWRDLVPAGHKQLIRRVFVHVDDLIGATATENQLRRGKRFQVQRWLGNGTKTVVTGKGRTRTRKKLGTAIADFFWPTPPLAGGATARPSTKRMAAYIQLEFSRPRSWARPFRIWEIVAVTVHWTSEAAALTGAFAENVGRKVAQALRLEGPDQLDHVTDYDRGCIRYTRKAPPAEIPMTMPVGVNADA